jgi:glycosyltransferase involved in cell wall biosynthesis/SAM-dependent methyltransferase
MILRAIDSVLAQDYSPIEIIVVDDGSSDGTEAALAGLAARGTIRYFRHPACRGAQAARNTGIRNAAGKYVAFLDSDDEWFPGKTRLQVALLERCDSPCVAHGGCRVLDEATGIESDFPVPPLDGDVHSRLLSAPGPMFQCMMAPKACFDEIGLLDERVPAYQEWDSAILLARRFEFRFLAGPLMRYRLHGTARISADGVRAADGWRYVVEKHRADIVRLLGRKAMAGHFTTAGSLYFAAHRVGKARRMFLRAALLDPTSPGQVALGIASLLGNRSLERAVNRLPLPRIFRALRAKRREAAAAEAAARAAVPPTDLPEYAGPTPAELSVIESAFVEAGIPVHDYRIDPAAFHAFNRAFRFGKRYYGGPGAPLYLEKVVEHFIGYDLGIRNIEKGRAVCLDVAAAGSPWAGLLRKNGYRAWAIDMIAQGDDSSPRYIRMDATHTAFRDGAIAFAGLQCAFEMFTGDADSRLVGELSRILAPGGRAVIAPLYMHTRHCGYCTPEYAGRTEFHDAGARLYVHRGFLGVPFSRKYDVPTLKSRVLDTIVGAGMRYRILALRNGPEIGEGIYCAFVLEIVRPG